MLPVTEFATGIFTAEPPVDLGPQAICSAVPGARLLLQGGKIRNPARPQALARKEADLDLSPIQPAAVFGCVVNRTAIPEVASG